MFSNSFSEKFKEKQQNNLPTCAKCGLVLSGSWDMTQGLFPSIKSRYLGIKNGYFLNGNSADQVFCYCYECWKAQILKLSFVTDYLNVNLQPQLHSLKLQIENKVIEINQLKANIQHLNGEIRIKDKEIEAKNARLEDIAELEADELEINPKNQEITLENEKIKEFEERLQTNGQELKSAHEQNKQLKKGIEYLTQTLQKKNNDSSVINDSLKKILGNSEALSLLEGALKDINDEQTTIIKTNGLDLASAQDFIVEEIRKFSDVFLKNKISLLSQLCEESIQSCNYKLMKIEESKNQVLGALKIDGELFTETDVLKALEPITKRLEKEETLKKKWIDLNQKLLSNNDKDNNQNIGE